MEFLSTSDKFYNASQALGLDVVASQWLRMREMSQLLLEISDNLEDKYGDDMNGA